MKLKNSDGAKALYQLAMISAYKGGGVAKAAAESLDLPFDEIKVQKLADELALDREVAENALFEEWKARRKSRIGEVIASFKTLVTALKDKAAIEVSMLTAALFQPSGIRIIATRATEPEENAKTHEPLNWRVQTIEDELSPPDVRLTLTTDFPANDAVEFVVLGVNAALFQIMKEAPSDGTLAASDDIHVLWEGSLLPVRQENCQSVQITFKMPDGLEITDSDSHLNVQLQQDTQGVCGVILKLNVAQNAG